MIPEVEALEEFDISQKMYIVMLAIRNHKPEGGYLTPELITEMADSLNRDTVYVHNILKSLADGEYIKGQSFQPNATMEGLRSPYKTENKLLTTLEKIDLKASLIRRDRGDQMRQEKIEDQRHRENTDLVRKQLRATYLIALIGPALSSITSIFVTAQALDKITGLIAAYAVIAGLAVALVASVIHRNLSPKAQKGGDAHA